MTRRMLLGSSNNMWIRGLGEYLPLRIQHDPKTPPIWTSTSPPATWSSFRFTLATLLVFQKSPLVTRRKRLTWNLKMGLRKTMFRRPTRRGLQVPCGSLAGLTAKTLHCYLLAKPLVPMSFGAWNRHDMWSVTAICARLCHGLSGIETGVVTFQGKVPGSLVEMAAFGKEHIQQ